MRGEAVISSNRRSALSCSMRRCLGWPVLWVLEAVCSLSLLPVATVAEPVQRSAGIQLGVDGSRFTVDGRPAFLLGASYYGALGAEKDRWQSDLEQLRRLRYNWVRVWAVWPAFDDDVSAVDSRGQPRERYLHRLQELVGLCDQLGLVVDVTLSRKHPLESRACFESAEALRRAAITLVRELRPHRNWYLDLANERNIRDARFVGMAELAAMVREIRRHDPNRLLTASHAGELSRDDLRAYLEEAKIDFLSVHLPRQSGQPRQGAEQTRQYRRWLEEMKRPVPLHHQEPFRRDYGRWQPQVEDFLEDLRGALSAGAAGWCFHNGDNRHDRERRPRRCFDLRHKGLLEQLDPVEKDLLRRLPEEAFGPMPPP